MIDYTIGVCLCGNGKAMRKEYSDRRRILAEKDIINDPFELFHHWFEVAKQKAPDDKWTETNAVCLSTATKFV